MKMFKNYRLSTKRNFDEEAAPKQEEKKSTKKYTWGSSLWDGKEGAKIGGVLGGAATTAGLAGYDFKKYKTAKKAAENTSYIKDAAYVALRTNWEENIPNTNDKDAFDFIIGEIQGAKNDIEKKSRAIKLALTDNDYSDYIYGTRPSKADPKLKVLFLEDLYNSKSSKTVQDIIKYALTDSSVTSNAAVNQMLAAHPTIWDNLLKDKNFTKIDFNKIDEYLSKLYQSKNQALIDSFKNSCKTILKTDGINNINKLNAQHMLSLTDPGWSRLNNMLNNKEFLVQLFSPYEEALPRLARLSEDYWEHILDLTVDGTRLTIKDMLSDALIPYMRKAQDPTNYVDIIRAFKKDNNPNELTQLIRNIVKDTSQYLTKETKDFIPLLKAAMNRRFNGSTEYIETKAATILRNAQQNIDTWLNTSTNILPPAFTDMSLNMTKIQDLVKDGKLPPEEFEAVAKHVEDFMSLVNQRGNHNDQYADLIAKIKNIADKYDQPLKKVSPAYIVDLTTRDKIKLQAGKTTTDELGSSIPKLKQFLKSSKGKYAFAIAGGAAIASGIGYALDLLFTTVKDNVKKAMQSAIKNKDEDVVIVKYDKKYFKNTLLNGFDDAVEENVKKHMPLGAKIDWLYFSPRFYFTAYTNEKTGKTQDLVFFRCYMTGVSKGKVNDVEIMKVFTARTKFVHIPIGVEIDEEEFDRYFKQKTLNIVQLRNHIGGVNTSETNKSLWAGKDLVQAYKKWDELAKEEPAEMFSLPSAADDEFAQKDTTKSYTENVIPFDDVNDI